MCVIVRLYRPRVLCVVKIPQPVNPSLPGTCTQVGPAHPVTLCLWAVYRISKSTARQGAKKGGGPHSSRSAKRNKVPADHDERIRRERRDRNSQRGGTPIGWATDVEESVSAATSFDFFPEKIWRGPLLLSYTVRICVSASSLAARSLTAWISTEIWVTRDQANRGTRTGLDVSTLPDRMAPLLFARVHGFDNREESWLILVNRLVVLLGVGRGRRWEDRGGLKLSVKPLRRTNTWQAGVKERALTFYYGSFRAFLGGLGFGSTGRRTGRSCQTNLLSE